MAGIFVPIILSGARAVSRVAIKKAAELVKAGKAKYAKDVARELDEGVTRIMKKGKGKDAPKLDLPGAAKRKAAAAAKRKAAAAKKKATTTTTTTTTTPKKTPNLLFPGRGRIPKSSRTITQITPKKIKSRKGLKEVGLATGIAGGIGYFAGTGMTKSVTVKAGDTLSQIAQDNNTTVAAIKKANPSITNIHRITPGQTIKVPKVKDRKSVYQGMTTAELQQPKKTTTTASKIKYGPGGYGASKSGGIVKRKSGGTVKKYAEGKMIGSKRLPRPKGIGAALKGWGKTGSS